MSEKNFYCSLSVWGISVIPDSEQLEEELKAEFSALSEKLKAKYSRLKMGYSVSNLSKPQSDSWMAWHERELP